MRHAPNGGTLAVDTFNVRNALEIEDGLTDWEVMFIESIGRRVLDDKKILTVTQREHLDEILRKHDR